ncbi:hypothetical protein FKM82_017404, partial [Ascaphus truei]
MALVVVAVICVPVLLLGDPIYLYVQHRWKRSCRGQRDQGSLNDGERSPLLEGEITEPGTNIAHSKDTEHGE